MSITPTPTPAVTIGTSIKLDAEHHDALTAAVASANAAQKPGAAPITAGTYLQGVLVTHVQGLAAAAYDAAVARLGTAAKQLPYPDRQALISQVETKVGS